VILVERSLLDDRDKAGTILDYLRSADAASHVARAISRVYMHIPSAAEAASFSRWLRHG
jgi:hypothetical protein